MGLNIKAIFNDNNWSLVKSYHSLSLIFLHLSQMIGYKWMGSSESVIQRYTNKVQYNPNTN